jgi:hypoxanthine phosphoribosyltransferase
MTNNNLKIKHIDPDTLLIDSFKLGKAVYDSGFRPRHAISLWRGGTPIGLGVDAYFRLQGISINHTSLATASYTGINSQEDVVVRGLEHLIKAVCAEDSVLIIDDVYESGRTIEKVITLLKNSARANLPEEIVVATVHRKPGKNLFPHRKVISLYDINEDVWIDYPHELSDLYAAAGKNNALLEKKDKKIINILTGPDKEFLPRKIENPGNFIYPRLSELYYDSFRLGMQVYRDRTFRPDYIIALWPGGVVTGLPLQEVFKYMNMKDGKNEKSPDHIAINTSRHYLSYRTNIIGLRYLEDNINKNDNILLIDTTFRGGKTVNAVIIRLKQALKRNLTLDNIRVASVYFNPKDKTTWVTDPVIKKPHYYLKEVDCEVVYPHNIHKIPDRKNFLARANPELLDILM